MIDHDNIEELIGKYLSGEATPDEAIALEEWKGKSDENAKYFADCQQLFSVLPIEIDTQSAWKKVKEEIAPKDQKQSTWSYLRIAASIALIATLTFFITNQFNNEGDVLSYETSEVEQNILLSDSTSVVLAPNSQLTYAADYGKTNRTVILKGNAHFKVVHEDSLPFLIEMNDLFIKDIGTEFNVEQSVTTDTIIVRVEEGVVLMFDNTGSEITVTADEKAIYIKSQKRLQKIIEKNPDAVLKFDFNGKSLREILDELGKAYDISITLESAKLENCQVTTQFNNEDVETILSVITETLGLKFVKTPEGYQIKGSKCNG